MYLLLDIILLIDAVLLIVAGIVLGDNYLTVLGFLTILFVFNHATYRALSEELKKLRRC